MSDRRIPKKSFKLEPPDGGWGYVIFLSFIAFHLINVVPYTSFGLIYGKFLASTGDETAQTALVNGIYFTVEMCSGVICNILLRRFSLRQVGLAGACFHIAGTFASIFMQTLPHFIICYSILEGLGVGFMLSAIFCSFNSYFHKKLNLMTGIGQTCAVLGVMVAPLIIAFVMEHLGFRKTLGLLTGISLLNLIGTGVLDPVEKHMKKVFDDGDCKNARDIPKKKNSKCDKNTITQAESLLEIEDERRGSKTSCIYVPLTNFVSLDESNPTNRKQPLFDFSLLKSAKYWNLLLGISFTWTSDAAFDALIPSLLQPYGFSNTQIAYVMTVCFGCDLATRIIYSILSMFFNFKNKPLYFAASLFTGIFRIAFIMNSSYLWIIITLGIYGVGRSFIQTTLALVIADEYKHNYTSAFPIGMMINGLMNLTVGGLSSLVKMLTKRDIMVVYLLSVANFLCIACWSFEFIYRKTKSKSSKL